MNPHTLHGSKNTKILKKSNILKSESSSLDAVSKKIFKDRSTISAAFLA